MSSKEKTLEEMKKETEKNLTSIFYLEDGRIIHGGIVYKDREQFIKVTNWSAKITIGLSNILNFFSFKKRK